MEKTGLPRAVRFRVSPDINAGKVKRWMLCKPNGREYCR